MNEEDGIRLTDEQKRRQRARSIAIAAVLFGLVALFYVVTHRQDGTRRCPQPAFVRV